MGIRFFCPHCQSRLNVKSSQAGHAGVCPDCGATVDVPAESLLPGIPKSPSQRFYIEETNPPEGSSQLIGFESQDTIVGDLVGEPEVATSSTADPTDSRSPLFATSADSSGIFMLDQPSPSPDFGKVDPILAAPDKVWYFRNKELGERGPLKSKIMQQHIDSGDVSAGSMVWREDWEDWATAEAAFPQITGPIDLLADIQEEENRLKMSSAPASKHVLAKQVLFYGAIVAGLVVVAALAYVVVWISHN